MKLIKIENHEENNRRGRLRFIDATFKRDDGKRYIFHFLESDRKQYLADYVEKAGKYYHLDGFTARGFSRCPRLPRRYEIEGLKKTAQALGGEFLPKAAPAL